MLNLGPNPVLLLIDVQSGFDHGAWGERNNLHAEANIARLLTFWRQTERPVFHVRHDSTDPTSPLRPGQPGNDFKPPFIPQGTEPVFAKTVNSAFIGTRLETTLRAGNHQSVVIAGLTTNHCVSTTARMAGNLGFQTYVVSDATACFDRVGLDAHLRPAEEVHAAALSDLHGEFATVVETNALIRQLTP